MHRWLTGTIKGWMPLKRQLKGAQSYLLNLAMR